MEMPASKARSAWLMARRLRQPRSRLPTGCGCSGDICAARESMAAIMRRTLSAVNVRRGHVYVKLAAIFRIRWAVKSSAGKNVSSASSDSVMSTGVPKIIVVEIKLKTSPLSRILKGIATLSAGSGPERAGIG